MKRSVLVGVLVSSLFFWGTSYARKGDLPESPRLLLLEDIQLNAPIIKPQVPEWIFSSLPKENGFVKVSIEIKADEYVFTMPSIEPGQKTEHLFFAPKPGKKNRDTQLFYSSPALDPIVRIQSQKNSRLWMPSSWTYQAIDLTLSEIERPIASITVTPQIRQPSIFEQEFYFYEGVADQMRAYKLVNRKPDKENGRFSLSFRPFPHGDEVKETSGRNLILIEPESPSREILMLGKKDSNHFILIFRSPLSPAQALAFGASALAPILDHPLKSKDIDDKN